MNNKEKVLEWLFEEPNREFHIRLLARLTKLHPNTIITITEEFAKEKIVIKKRDKDTNRVIIQANEVSLNYKLKKQFYNIEKIYKSGLIYFLEDELAYPTIILFGSYAKAENHPRSDIDLFVVSSLKKDIDLSSYEKKLGAEIQLILHKKEELARLKKTSPELLNNVINGYKLAGFLEVF